MFWKNSSSLSKLVEGGIIRTEESHFKKEKKTRSEQNLGWSTDSDHRKRSSLAKLWRKSSSKSGFIGFGNTEDTVGSKSLHKKKGNIGFGKSNYFFETENDNKPLEYDNKQEQKKAKDNIQENVWNQIPGGCKYQVRNTPKQQVQSLEQNCPQSSQKSIASALGPIIKDPKKLWGRRKKGSHLFDDGSHIVGKSLTSFFSSNRYQTMRKSNQTDDFNGLALDSTTSPDPSLLSRIMTKAKRKIKDMGEDSSKTGYTISQSESDSAEGFEEAGDPFSDVKELTKGVKEVVLEQEESEDSDEAEDSSSTSVSSSSDESESNGKYWS